MANITDSIKILKNINILFIFIHFITLLISTSDNICSDYKFSLLINIYLILQLKFNISSIGILYIISNDKMKMKIKFNLIISSFSILTSLVYTGLSLFIYFNIEFTCRDLSYIIYIIYTIYPSLENYLLFGISVNIYRKLKKTENNLINASSNNSENSSDISISI
jgi:hypothetical protein